jgi:hypothetical protein
VKPGYHGSEPADIRAYAALHEEFPHESTADQWFSESQMESYRALGSHIIGKMCHSHGENPPHSCDKDFAQLEIEEFISSVREYLENTRPQPAAAERSTDPRLATGPSADSLLTPGSRYGASSGESVAAATVARARLWWQDPPISMPEGFEQN